MNYSYINQYNTVISSINSTLVKYYITENVIKKLSFYKKIKITANADRTIKYTFTALYSEVYF